MRKKIFGISGIQLINMIYDTVGYTEIDVHPTDMIILAKSCWGMIDLAMAKAFVDYGATAYCGVKVRDWASSIIKKNCMED